MCIRDRASRWLNYVDLPNPKIGEWECSGLVAILKGQGDTCLLYTSDAADERSSVDLGGRRIIKKKNTTTITSSSCNIKKKLDI